MYQKSCKKCFRDLEDAEIRGNMKECIDCLNDQKRSQRYRSQQHINLLYQRCEEIKNQIAFLSKDYEKCLRYLELRCKESGLTAQIGE